MRSLTAGLSTPALAMLGVAALALPAALPAVNGLWGAGWWLAQDPATLAADPALQASVADLWPSARVLAMLWRGLALSLLSGGMATALGGLCVLALLPPHGRRWRAGLVALLAASFCFGTVVHLMAWRVLFPGVTGGAAGWALAVLSLGGRYAPLAAALLATGLASLDRAELEAALCTGGARAAWAVARGRVLRLASMSVAAVMALAFGESELPPLLGLSVYAEEFLSQVALQASSELAVAHGWPMMVLAVLCGLWLARLPRMRAMSDGAVSTGWLGGWPVPAAGLRGLSALAWAVAATPLLLLALGSVLATGRWPTHALLAIGDTLWIAACSATLACLWGWLLAEWAARAGGRSVALVNTLLLLLVLWPSALTGVAIAGWSFPTWAGAQTPMILAHTLRILPFAAWVLLALRDADAAGPREQLALLGAPRWPALRHVAWPAARPRLAAAFMLGVGLSLAELTATVLTVPPGMETVILRLYNLLHYGDQRGVMALALAQGAAVALLAATAVLLLRGKPHA